MHLKQAAMRLNELRKSFQSGRKSIGKMVSFGSGINWKQNHIKTEHLGRMKWLMIDVLFFAELHEAVGENKLSFDVENITVNELKSTWLEKYHAESLDKAMIAVNEEYVGEETVLQRGDVVAFIPPVSGG